ncbi:MAG: hypothetical protein LBS27_10600 [Bifidobacteriaceae bacterium]|jgi:hypothetical protein|nr:hypothetical protein [Bifidobacteriaceae bacterium]
MRRLSGTVAAVVLIAVLAGRTSPGSGDSDPEAGRSRSEAGGGQAPTAALAVAIPGDTALASFKPFLDGPVLDADQAQAALEEAHARREQITSSCMKDAGFTYEPAPEELGGCAAQARTEVPEQQADGSAFDLYHSLAWQVADVTLKSVPADPKAVSASDGWNKCMLDKGVDIATYLAGGSEPDATLSAGSDTAYYNFPTPQVAVELARGLEPGGCWEAR